MNNIFENAYFGKAYKTRDGRKAIYVEKNVYLSGSYVRIEGKDGIFYIGMDGHYLKDKESDFDIVSEWQEPINEDELDELGKNYHYQKENGMPTGIDLYTASDLCDAFKAGYRKALEINKR